MARHGAPGATRRGADVGRRAPLGDGRSADTEPYLLRIRGVAKRYGNTQALAGIDLVIRPGEIVGVVGHNGAGKSTLMRVIAGLTEPDAGAVELAGSDGGGRHDQARASAWGVRIAFQELSLCPTLRVFENTIVAHRALAGLGAPRRAQAAIRAQLNDLFPGHGISPRQRISSLSLAQRQMLEVAHATLDTGSAPRLLILDEPTSALGKESADSLFRYLRAAVGRGLSCILISHRIAEILANTHRVVVMRNGQIVTERAAAELSEEETIGLMGATTVQTVTAASGPAMTGGTPVVEVAGMSAGPLREVSMQVRPGEIVGLAGLDGQGQRDLLLAIWRQRRAAQRSVRVRGRLAFVTGDRQAAGIFPLWPVAHNLSISSLFRLSRAGVIDPRAEVRVGAKWVERLAIKGTLATPVPDLSGGTQQKVLVARALAVGADVVLLDDPFRGVDVGTKRDLYRLLRDEAARGRCFIWFTTENLELEECDRVYVLHGGRVVAVLSGEEISEERIIAASFGGVR